jgi:hypothetical protein
MVSGAIDYLDERVLAKGPAKEFLSQLLMNGCVWMTLNTVYYSSHFLNAYRIVQ